VYKKITIRAYVNRKQMAQKRCTQISVLEKMESGTTGLSFFVIFTGQNVVGRPSDIGLISNYIWAQNSDAIVVPQDCTNTNFNATVRPVVSA